MKYYDDPSNPKSPFIDGPTVKMLREGGPWREGEPVPTHYDFYRPGARMRTKAREVEWYPGEVAYEPSYKVSNVKWTGTIIRHMFVRGFSIERIEWHLSRRENMGGSFWRFICHLIPDFVERTTQTAHDYDRPSPNKDAGVFIRGTVATAWKESPEGFKVQREEAIRLLRWLRLNGEMNMSEVRSAGVLNFKILTTYMNALEYAGLITVTLETRASSNGGMRMMKVVRVADPATILLYLGVDNLPEEDRPFWEALAPVPEPEPFTTTFEEMLARRYVAEERQESRLSPVLMSPEVVDSLFPPGRPGTSYGFYFARLENQRKATVLA